MAITSYNSKSRADTRNNHLQPAGWSRRHCTQLSAKNFPGFCFWNCWDERNAATQLFKVWHAVYTATMLHV